REQFKIRAECDEKLAKADSRREFNKELRECRKKLAEWHAKQREEAFKAWAEREKKWRERWDGWLEPPSLRERSVQQTAAYVEESARAGRRVSRRRSPIDVTNSVRDASYSLTVKPTLIVTW